MRILVARPQADAERTAARLAALGHEPVIAPVLAVARTPDAPPAGPFDALIVTSANAVPALSALAGAAGLPVFAVGARTAALAAGRVGFIHVAEGDAASLAVLVRRHLRPGARLLHVAGRDRKPEPGASLAAAGYMVEVWAVYEAQAAARLPDAARIALERDELDAALHYSRRSAAVLLRLVRAAGLAPPFLVLEHLCLSPDAAAPLREAGAQRIIAADRPDEEALLAKINRGGPNRKDRRKPQVGARDGTNPSAPVSLSSSSAQEPSVTDTPPDLSNPRPRRTGPYREPPTLDLKATVVPDESSGPSATKGESKPGTPTGPAEAAASGAVHDADSTPPPLVEPPVADDASTPTTDAPTKAAAPTTGSSPPKVRRSRVYPAIEEAPPTPAPDRAEPKAASEDRAVTEAVEATPTPAAEPAPPLPPPAARRGPGVGALLGTGILGGLIGAGLATLGQSYLNPSRNQSDPRIEQIEQRLANAPSREAVGALERRVSALDAEQKSLGDRLRAASQATPATVGPAQDAGGGGQAPTTNATPATAAPDLAPALESLTARLAALETQVREQAQARAQAPASDQAQPTQAQPSLEAVQAVEQRLTAAQAQLRDQLQAAIEAGARGLEQRLTALDQRLTAALGQARDQAQANAETARTLERRAAEQDQRLGALTQKVEDRRPAETATAALRVSLADQVGEALRTGAALGPTLGALRRLNVDPQALAALEPYAAQGAPSAAALARDFKPLADRIVAESRPASANASWTDRLWRMADQVVTVRSVTDTGGGDAPSLVARIQAALAAGSLRDAAAAWDALPEPARRLSEEWGRRLKQRLAAEDAARALSDRALTALDAATR